MADLARPAQEICVMSVKIPCKYTTVKGTP